MGRFFGDKAIELAVERIHVADFLFSIKNNFIYKYKNVYRFIFVNKVILNHKVYTLSR
jgi:hypothetical protein